MSPRLRAVWITLAAFGIVLCAVLELLHVQTYLDPSVSSVCSLGEKLDCNTVALSGSSVLFGVPLAIWGLVGWSVLLLAAVRRPALVLPFSAVAALGGVVYTLVSAFVVGSFCIFCEVAHLLALVAFALAWWKRDLVATRAALADRRTLAIWLGGPLLAVVVLHLFLPRYWTIASWEQGVPFAHGIDENGRPWIGAVHPRLVVHEYIDYYCPHCRVAHGRMRMRIAAHPDTLRIVRHQMPRMRCPPPTKGTGGQRCHAVRVAICAGAQGRFWQMDDWLVGHAPGGSARIDVARAAEEVGLDPRRLRDCMTSRSTWEKADRDVREAQARGIRGTPAYVIRGRTMTHAQADDEIENAL